MKKCFQIPDEFQERVRKASDLDDLSQVQFECLEKQYDKAVEAGNVQEAFQTKQSKRRQAHECDKARKALWALIHEALPQLDKEDNFTLSVEQMLVAPKNDGLAGILGGLRAG